MDVQVQHASQHAETHQLVLQLKQTTHADREPDTLPPHEHHGDESDIDNPGICAQASLTSQGGKFSGQFTVQREALDCVELMTRAPLLKFESHADAEPLRFDASGQWPDVQLMLNGAPPTWLSKTVATEADAKMKIATEAAKQQLDQVFATELLQLKQLVASAISDSKPLIVKQERQLLAAQDRLQQQVDNQQGTEFARRPGAIAR